MTPRAFSTVVLLALIACGREEPILYPSQPGYSVQQPGAAGSPPGTGGGQAANPSPTTSSPIANPPGTNPNDDPINRVDLAFLRQRASAILTELVNALPATYSSRVSGIPLVVDSTVGEVNAFAACSRSNRAAMAITDGLLEIQARLAQAAAVDELYGSRKVDEYVAFIAQHQRPKTPIAQPPAGFIPTDQAQNPNKIGRQHQILEEQIAFVLGHELAHHYLGHLPCTQQGALPTAEIGAVLSNAIPALNQPNEIAADIAGINDVLRAGARRSYHWTEAGGILTMRFFSGLHQLRAEDVLFGFELSHPPPQIRLPIIQQTAATYRALGGRVLGWD
jgi:hypothetical protein